MKAEVRISINDYDGNSEEFIVEGEGGPSPRPSPVGRERGTGYVGGVAAASLPGPLSVG